MPETLYLTAAHTSGEPLPELVGELRAIEAALRTLHERGLYRLESNRATNLDDIFQFFSREGAAIRLFHYAGHAGQQELCIEGGGKARGISELFGLSQGARLQLVFLNGCASIGILADLQKNGLQNTAIIATSCPIGDTMARDFSSCFYRTWAMEGKTLEQAFQTAVAYVHSKEGGQNREITVRSTGFQETEENQELPWALYLHPELPEAGRKQLLQWKLNETPKLPEIILQNVRTTASESLMDLVFEFENNDEDARAEIVAGQDPLLTLITRLPWTIGTHLRRLFALEDSQSMSEPGRERLNELLSGYTELTRFISYTALSSLWNDRQSTGPARELFAGLQLVPDLDDSDKIDFIFRLREYHKILSEIPGDPILLEEKIGGFLKKVDTELAEPYRFMEELKQALADPEPARLDELALARTGEAAGLAKMCLQADAVFAGFLRAALFLTEYKLYTVRTIVVDKLRFLDQPSPYVHKTMTLHGAFSDIKLIPTQRAVASDNYSILLAPRKQADPLANALNLSPFYIDKSAYLEEKTGNYPAIFVLKHRTPEQEFVYEYLDGDVNHQYSFAEGHLLRIKQSGAVFPPALKISLADSRKFELIHRQLVRLQNDFAL